MNKIRPQAHMAQDKSNTIFMWFFSSLISTINSTNEVNTWNSFKLLVSLPHSTQAHDLFSIISPNVNIFSVSFSLSTSLWSLKKSIPRSLFTGKAWVQTFWLFFFRYFMIVNSFSRNGLKWETSRGLCKCIN